MRRILSTRFLGLVTFIAAGCGSKSEPPVVTPSVASPIGEPSLIERKTKADRVFGAEVEFDWVPGVRPPGRPPLAAPSVAIPDPELDPLVSYLKAEFSKPIKDGLRLIINEMTDMEDLRVPGQDYQDFLDMMLNQASKDIPAEMILDFCRKNRKSHVVWPVLTRHLPAETLTPDDEKGIYKHDGDDWKRFYAKYPDAYGKLRFSRVGLNRDKTVALIDVGIMRGGLNGHGQLHVLKKVRDEWVELPIVFGPVWDS